MPSLHELQHSFLGAARSAGERAILDAIVADRIDPATRLAVYRNNYLVNLTQTLAASYPVVARLVGREFFGHVAEAYIARNPSRSGNLEDYGAAFPGFLDAFPALDGLPYIADVARLEWLIGKVLTAADAPPAEPAAVLAALSDPEQLPMLLLAPCARLFASAYPAHRIWQVNQPGWAGDDTVDLADGPARLILRRAGIDLEWIIATESEFAFLKGLEDGSGLAAAAAAAQAVDASFDAVTALYRRVTDGTLSLAGLGRRGRC